MGCNVEPEIIICNTFKSFKSDIKNSQSSAGCISTDDSESIISNNNINNSLNNIKSRYILKILFELLEEKRYLNLILNNKKIQNKLNISLIDYKNYKRIQIEIEIIKELKEEKNYFINLNEDKSLYIIYFDGKEEESRRNYVKRDEKVRKITVIINLGIKSFRGLFNECKCIKKIKFTKFNRNDIIDMSNMFYSCSNLVKLDLSNLKTDNVKSMWYMFYGCKSLKSLDLSSFRTDNVINMRGMFWGCSSLSYLDISNFRTDNVINMSGLLYGCSSLNDLNIQNWNTDKVTNMWYMFYGCKSLSNLDISNIHTDKVTNMSYMFSYCESLIDLDISNFKVDKVTNMSFMFSNCKSLINLDVSNFRISKNININGVFSGCSEKLLNKIREQNKDMIKEDKCIDNYYCK